MAIVVSLSVTSPGPTMAGSVINGICQVQNTEAGSVTIRDIKLFEMNASALTQPPSGPPSTLGAIFRNPDFLVPNVAPGTYPTVTTTTTVYYPWSVVVPSPNMPGPSPGATNVYRSVNQAMPPGNSTVTIGCVVLANDGTSNIVGSATLQIPVISAVDPFPMPSYGTEQFNVAGDAVNWFFF